MISWLKSASVARRRRHIAAAFPLDCRPLFGLTFYPGTDTGERPFVLLDLITLRKRSDREYSARLPGSLDLFILRRLVFGPRHCTPPPPRPGHRPPIQTHHTRCRRGPWVAVPGIAAPRGAEIHAANGPRPRTIGRRDATDHSRRPQGALPPPPSPPPPSSLKASERRCISGGIMRVLGTVATKSSLSSCTARAAPLICCFGVRKSAPTVRDVPAVSRDHALQTTPAASSRRWACGDACR